MQTSVIGFPRIGTLRELKFASEKYFKKGNFRKGIATNRERAAGYTLEYTETGWH